MKPSFLRTTLLLAICILLYTCTKKKDDPKPIVSQPVIPSIPTGLSLLIKNTTAITVKWNSVTNALGYRLYRDNAKVYEGTQLEYSDTGLTSNTAYDYAVSSFSKDGESSKSAILSIKTDEIKPVIPTVPSSPALVSKSITVISLKWDSVATASGYRLYRGDNKIFEGKKYAYTDSNLTANTSYNYSVSAFNNAGESAKSSVLSIKTDPLPAASTNIHLTLGNPTNAKENTGEANDYLLIKPQYVMSYNNTLHRANWVSWELSKSWLGSVERQDDFRPDAALPTGWYRVVPGDYTNTGFDRGHLCPSADRSKTLEDNSSTFLMTNIIPQAPDLNRESWAYLEDYCRNVVKTGYKAFITAGTIGTGGVGSNGAANTVKNQVNVPARVYKIIVLYSESGSVNSTSKVIAVNFPNTNGENKETSWLKYVTTVTEIEKQSGASFFSSLPISTQNTLKSQKYDAANSPFDVDAPVRSYNGHVLQIGPRGGCYYINSNGNKTYVDRSFCGTE